MPQALHPAPAFAETNLYEKSKQLEAELKVALMQRGATLQELRQSPQVGEGNNTAGPCCSMVLVGGPHCAASRAWEGSERPPPGVGPAHRQGAATTARMTSLCPCPRAVQLPIPDDLARPAPKPTSQVPSELAEQLRAQAEELRARAMEIRAKDQALAAKDGELRSVNEQLRERAKEVDSLRAAQAKAETERKKALAAAAEQRLADLQAEAERQKELRARLEQQNKKIELLMRELETVKVRGGLGGGQEGGDRLPAGRKGVGAGGMRARKACSWQDWCRCMRRPGATILWDAAAERRACFRPAALELHLGREGRDGQAAQWPLCESEWLLLPCSRAA